MHKIFILLSSCFVFLMLGCNAETQTEKDRQLIRDYLAENNLEADFHPSGLFYSISDAGGNVNPTIRNRVEVRYKGMLLDGTVFDETSGRTTIEFPLSTVIAGWQVGIPLIGRGGEIRLYIPSGLGYGRAAQGSIPANSVLIFDVELVDFE